MKRLGRYSRAYIALGTLYGAGDLLMGTNHVVYLQENHLTGFQASLVVGLFAAAVALFDLPTGAIADSWGRKRTMVWGFFIIAAGEALFGLAGTRPLAALAGGVTPFLVSSILRGLGAALLSGVFISWYFGALGGAANARETSLALSLGSALRHLGGWRPACWLPC